MRSTCRLFLAAILLVLAARVAPAQVTSTAPPASAPQVDALRPIPFAISNASDVVSPARVGELRPIPFAQPNSPAASPALTVDPSALAIEPVVPATAEPAAATSKPPTKKTKKLAKKPTVTVSESFQSGAPIAVAAAAVDITASTPPPPGAGVEPAVVADSSSATRPETTERITIGGWMLYGVLVALLFGFVTLIRRRLTLRSTALPRVDFTAPIPKLKPALAPRS
jgi:hypothetical protein